MTMTRRGRTPSAASTFAAWLIPTGGLMVYAGLVVWLASMRSWPDLSLPWWLAQALPPIVYGGLVFVFVRGVTVPRLVIATAALWAVHMLIGTLTGLAVMRIDAAASAEPLAGFPPPPLPQLLWVPLLLFPLRNAIGGVPHRRALSRAKGRERVPSADVRTPVVPAQSLGLATAPAFQSAAPASSPALARPIEPSPREPSPRTPTVENGRPMRGRTAAMEPDPPTPVSAKIVAEPPAPPQPLSEEVLAQETSTDVVRVSFERVVAQLPAGAFQLPTDRMAAGLLEPGFLLIPMRLVVAQLAEGHVRTSWKVVREQFPRHLLAMTDEEIVRQLPDGQVVLPLDELVPQLPSDIFVFSLPTVDVGALESFPAPFQPAFAEDIDEGQTRAPSVEVAVAPIGEEPVEPPTTTTTAWVLEDSPLFEKDEAVEVGRFTTASSDETMVDPAVAPVAVGISELESQPTPAEEVEATLTEVPPVPEPEPVMTAVSAAPDLPMRHGSLTNEGPAEFSYAAGDATLAGAPARILDSVAAPADCPPTPDDLAAADRVAAMLASFKVLDVHVQPVDGVKLFVASPRGSDTTSVVGAARPLVSLLADARAPWPVDQMTLRGPSAALVITPLGVAGRRGPALVVAVNVGAQLALLEVLALRAAAECAVPTTASGPDESPVHEERHEPDLIDTDASTRIRQIAGTLRALGPVSAAALRNPEAERNLYVFLPSGTDARMVGSFASELDGAMRKAGEAAGAVFSSAVLRCGKRRLIIRQENSDNERANILVAGGETERPGLAYRQVESVALALDAR